MGKEWALSLVCYKIFKNCVAFSVGVTWNNMSSFCKMSIVGWDTVGGINYW